MDLNSLSAKIIRAAITVHKELGPGLLESVYQRSMFIELSKMGANVQSEVPVAVFYRGEQVHQEGFRIDLLVEDSIIIELKSVEEIRKHPQEAASDLPSPLKKAFGSTHQFQRNLDQEWHYQSDKQPNRAGVREIRPRSSRSLCEFERARSLGERARETKRRNLWLTT
jgi:GxxExxY protein